MASIVDMLANFMGNAPNTQSRQVMNEFVGGTGGQGYMPSAQASQMQQSQMQPMQPSTLGPANVYGNPGPIRTADNIGHGIPGPSPGRADAFLRQLFGKSTLPQAGTRGQMFADFPRSGYDPTQRRY